ncbi:MAG: outer membrane lipoprotein carrier protein LolA [Polyangiales bacterium]
MIRFSSSWTCLAVLLLTASSYAQPAKAPIDLDTLLSAFAKMDGLEAKFVEEKRMQLLKAPLVSRGRLYFVGPGYLLRQIESPQPSKMLITPAALTVDDGVRRETIDLQARRDVRSFVGSFVSLLAGDKDALTASYRIQIRQADKGQWRLELAPKASPLSDIIRKVWVTGDGLSVAEIHVFDTNGDETITRMVDVNPNRQFDESERKALFGIEPS